MAGSVTLRGRWVDPAGYARAGRVIARRYDEYRAGPSVTLGASSAVLVDGSLPATGDGALQVAVPDSGSYLYDVVEALDDVNPVRYRITVAAGDSGGTVDLTALGGGEG